MPVRSLNSVVFKWPDRTTVLAAARAWAVERRRRDPRVRQVGAVGSYARGDWGVGSDLDLVIVIDDAPMTAVQHHARYAPENFPVPVDLWGHTQSGWEVLAARRPALWNYLQREWLDLLA